MFTITNGIILKGQDLTLTKENIVVDDGIIIDIGKDSMEGKIIDVDGQTGGYNLQIAWTTGFVAGSTIE